MRATLGDRPVGLAGMPQPFPMRHAAWGGGPIGTHQATAQPGPGQGRARCFRLPGGERVVIINPTDFPLIGPHGQVTADLLRRMGMNVDLAESDWGTVVQRRVRQEPVEQGGWSTSHLRLVLAYLNPAVSSLVKGPGRSGWFGWYDSPQMQELVQAWMDAPDADVRSRWRTRLTSWRRTTWRPSPSASLSSAPPTGSPSPGW